MRVFVYEHLSACGLLDAQSADAELLPSGLAMRDAMVQDLVRCSGCRVTVASGANVPTAGYGSTSVAAQAQESAFDFVARQAQSHDKVWLVAPETDGLLQQFAQQVDAARWMGCSSAAIALAASKSATSKHLSARGIATPLTYLDDPAVTRWVVKPDDGAGTVATQVYEDVTVAGADLERRRESGEVACMEPWIDGEALSISLCCSAQGCEMLSVNRQRLNLAAGGVLGYVGVDVNIMRASDARWHVLETLAAQLTRAMPGLHGFVGVDLVWHAEHGPIVIEVNPRVTCAYVGLSESLGRNMAAHLLSVPRTPSSYD